jgi:alpha-beta hydrolase superfamily lysophospholipase
MIYREKEVTVKGRVTLKGTLCFPETITEKNPAVLILPGTGKLDRNGKVNAKLDLKLYRQLADFMAAAGFISLRYDKRGVGESEGDYYAAGLWDLVDDARACVNFLKSLPEVDSEKVLVLGHSEGSILATAVGAREKVAGLILLAGAVQCIEDALKRQRDLARSDVMEAKGFLGFYLRLLGTQNKIEKAAKKVIDKVLNSQEDVIKINFVKTNAKWIREHFAYHPKTDLATITCPVLAITGGRDIQADPGVLKELPLYVKEDANYFIIENMGHSLKFQERTSTIFTAKKDIIAETKLPIHPELLEKLEVWLQQHFKEAPAEKAAIL